MPRPSLGAPPGAGVTCHGPVPGLGTCGSNLQGTQDLNDLVSQEEMGYDRGVLGGSDANAVNSGEGRLHPRASDAPAEKGIGVADEQVWAQAACPGGSAGLSCGARWCQCRWSTR